MAVNPYYVGTTLDTIGNNMSRDRGFEAQQAIAQAQARQQQAAMIQHALLQRQQMAQQQNQFAQEMAFRNAGQGQANQYQNALLAMRQQEMQNQMNGFSARDQADNTYRYAALENALKLEQERAKIPPYQLQVERDRQSSITARDLAQAQEAWDYNETAAKTKLGQYNALLDSIEQEAKEKEKRQSFGFDDPESRKIVADKFRKDKFAEVLQSLQLDKRPGDISPNPVTKRFEAVLPPRPGGQKVNTSVPNPGLYNNPVGFQVPAVGQPQQQNGVINGNVPVKVRSSDGRLWDTTAAMFEQFKRRDPGAQIVNTNSTPPVSHGASGSWEPNRTNALMDALYSQGTSGGYNAY